MSKDNINTMVFDNSLGNPDEQGMIENDGVAESCMFGLTSNIRRPDIDPVELFDYRTGDNNSPDFKKLQRELLAKFFNNPTISSTTRDYIGRMTGYGFKMYSDVPEIQNKIDIISNDYRNRLYEMLPKFAGRAFVQGELLLILTVHRDGFVEIDFVSPETLDSFGYDNGGKILHPTKSSFPLAYQFEFEGNNSGELREKVLIPSINIARYPELKSVLENTQDYKTSVAKKPIVGGKEFRGIGGYNRFVVEWDKSLITTRNLSHIASVLNYINYHESLKRLEIDFKKSVSTYVWAIEIEDPKVSKQFFTLSDEEKSKTGIMARKEAGATIVLPYGMKLKATNPNLPKLSGDDMDILALIQSGLNTTDDALFGTSSRNKSGLSETHGTQSDRTSDELAQWERFLRWGLWGNVLYLISQVDKRFKYVYKQKKVVDFKKKKPVTRFVEMEAPYLVEFSFPTSQNQQFSDRVKGFMGVKHSNLAKTLGISYSTIAKELGFSSYDELRRKLAEEDEKYPELKIEEDIEAIQEKTEGENSNNTDDDE